MNLVSTVNEPNRTKLANQTAISLLQVFESEIA